MWVNCQHVHFHIRARTYLVLLEITTTIVAIGLRLNVKKAQVCKYADSFAHTHTLTFVGATSSFVWAQSSTFSSRYIIVGAIRPILHQCDITSTTPECSMLLCFKQQFVSCFVFSFVLAFDFCRFFFSRFYPLHLFFYLHS